MKKAIEINLFLGEEMSMKNPSSAICRAKTRILVRCLWPIKKKLMDIGGGSSGQALTYCFEGPQLKPHFEQSCSLLFFFPLKNHLEHKQVLIIEIT